MPKKTKLKKSTMILSAALSAIAINTQAEIIELSGITYSSSGAMETLAMIGTPMTATLDFNSQTNYAQVILAGFCFSSDAYGAPPNSASCPEEKSAVPIFSRDQTSYGYDQEQHPVGTILDRPGSTFDGSSGLLSLYAYSPSLNQGMDIDFIFSGSGQGNWSIDVGFLGQVTGEFDVMEAPVPAAAWLFGSALLGLIGTKRKQLSRV